MNPYQIDFDFLAESSAPSEISEWSLLTPRPKSNPLQFHASRSQQPRIRSLFQVSDLAQSSLPASSPPSRRVEPVLHSSGLQCPTPRESSIGSLRYPDKQIHQGLPAPDFSQPCPSSLTSPSQDAEGVEDCSFSMPISRVPQLSKPARTSKPSDVSQSRNASDLTRVRIAAKSSMVWNLWLRVSACLHSVSSVIQQIQSSAYPVEHAERFLNQYAATTLVRYMSCILQFVEFCSTLHVPIETMSETRMADLLVSGSLARRSDGSGPKFSVTIKSLRWAYKQLGIQPLACMFGPLISSFDKQKLPGDRRESLPFPLFILMRWERRVLQSATPLQEVIILGGFLLLCWSGLRFSDLQRSHLSSWQLDANSLRGLTWRAKTCNSATPFGILLSGILSCGSWTWVHRYLQALDQLYLGESLDLIDFAIPAFDSNGVPVKPYDAMTYAEALYYLRLYLSLPWSSQGSQMAFNTSSYSVHGLKATVLSWAAQANLPEEDRRVHGKHKPAQLSVQLYSRDDILGSLRVQTNLISQIVKGWRPVTPLARGGQKPLVEPQFSVERFRKDKGDLEWKFFRFDQADGLQQLVTLPDTPLEELSEESSSDESSSSSSSDGSVEEPKPRRPKIPRTAAASHLIEADEAIVGLHRRTWHVMMVSDSQQPDLPCWQGQSLKTACGRFLIQMQVSASEAFELAPGQSMCSHGGCRKGFQSIGRIA